LRQDDDPGAEQDLARLRRQKREGDERIEDPVTGVHRRRWDARIGQDHMLTGPEGVEPGVLRKLRDPRRRNGITARPRVHREEAKLQSGHRWAPHRHRGDWRMNAF
jgi:hypothetical protein